MYSFGKIIMFQNGLINLTSLKSIVRSIYSNKIITQSRFNINFQNFAYSQIKTYFTLNAVRMVKYRHMIIYV
jgi:hypothetical protein